MSRHSKGAKTYREKSAQDAKRGAVFTKLSNLIIIAAKEGGGDINSNFKLRLAVDKAKAVNMPKDNIERAIKRGTGEGGGGNFEEITYEIMGPAGSGFIVEVITDNKNRTAGELKAILNKHGGSLSGPNSVLWMFNRKGVINLAADSLKNKNPDELELAIIDAGADDLEKTDDTWEVYTAPENLQSTINKLKEGGFNITDSTLSYLPKEELKISDPEVQSKIENLYNLLDDLDDVNNVYTNASW